MRYWANPVAWQRQSELQLRLIAVMIASCKHRVRGLKKPQIASVLRLSSKTISYPYTSRTCVIIIYNFVSLIYREYLANVHFSDIPHTFILHFTLHSAEKIRIEFSANYPLTTFRIPHSALRKIPLPTFWTVWRPLAWSIIRPCIQYTAGAASMAGACSYTGQCRRCVVYTDPTIGH